MNKTTRLMTACAIALGLCATAAAAPKNTPATQKKLYCWNEGGRRVCGDALPPEAVDRARVEMNSRNGLRSGEIARSLTPAERDAAAAAAKVAAQEAESRIAQQRRDLAMAQSYATEADLRRAYGERILLVDESLKTSRLSIVNLRQSLLSLLRQAAEFELQSKPVQKPLFDNIRNQHTDLLRQQAILQQQLHDRSTLGSELEAALERYRSLKMTRQPTIAG